MTQVVIRLTEGEVEAEGPPRGARSFLNLRQCGRPVDARLTYTQSIEVGAVSKSSIFSWRVVLLA